MHKHKHIDTHTHLQVQGISPLASSQVPPSVPRINLGNVVAKKIQVCDAEQALVGVDSDSVRGESSKYGEVSI